MLPWKSFVLVSSFKVHISMSLLQANQDRMDKKDHMMGEEAERS